MDGQGGGGGSAKKRGSHAGLAARFKAWSDGRRGELIRWWREARTRAWARLSEVGYEVGYLSLLGCVTVPEIPAASAPAASGPAGGENFGGGV